MEVSNCMFRFAGQPRHNMFWWVLSECEDIWRVECRRHWQDQTTRPAFATIQIIWVTPSIVVAWTSSMCESTYLQIANKVLWPAKAKVTRVKRLTHPLYLTQQSTKVVGVTSVRDLNKTLYQQQHIMF